MTDPLDFLDHDLDDSPVGPRPEALDEAVARVVRRELAVIMAAPAQVMDLREQVERLAPLAIRTEAAESAARQAIENATKTAATATRGNTALLANVNQARGYLEDAGLDVSQGWMEAVVAACRIVKESRLRPVLDDTLKATLVALGWTPPADAHFADPL